MRIVLVAQESAGIQALRLLGSSAHRVTAVLTGTEQETAGRGATVASVARHLGIRVLPAALVRDPAFRTEIGGDVDVLLNVHSLHLIAPEVLAAPRIGSFNLHPGPLPEFAGLNVPSWAVYHRRDRHGVTVHWMEPGIDTGPIAFSASFPLTPRDTGLTVSAKCVEHGIPLIAELLTCLERGPSEIPAEPQDLSRRRYFGRRVPHEGWVPWTHPAASVTAFVRACDYGPFPSPWGLPRASLGGTEITVLRVAATGQETAEPPGTVGERDGDGVRVATGDEWVVVRRVLVDGTSTTPHGALRAGDRLDPHAEGSSVS
jgi:UDP-4-amino-4-deoxy-L-arabinose formyltransferase/UDP-glucuronic acid dehydrogenase (UDP-4-keto-hexauronic acid decarboxylating)